MASVQRWLCCYIAVSEPWESGKWPYNSEVVGLQGDPVKQVTLYVEKRCLLVNSLEFPDPFDHFSILVIAEVVVVPSGVPRVKGMVANDVETFLRQATLFIADQDPIEVLVMTKGHHHI